MKITVFDKNDRKICESEWEISSVRGWLSTIDLQEYDYEKINDYFTQNVDINNRGFVNVDEWVIAMKKTGIDKEENKLTKIFYFMCFMNHCDTEQVSVKEFEKLICIQDHNVYIR